MPGSDGIYQASINKLRDKTVNKWLSVLKERLQTAFKQGKNSIEKFGPLLLYLNWSFHVPLLGKVVKKLLSNPETFGLVVLATFMGCLEKKLGGHLLGIPYFTAKSKSVQFLLKILKQEETEITAIVNELFAYLNAKIDGLMQGKEARGDDQSSENTLAKRINPHLVKIVEIILSNQNSQVIPQCLMEEIPRVVSLK